MPGSQIKIPPLFVSRFEVDYKAPFRRYLNRLEVEIGREDYEHLQRVELLEGAPSDKYFAEMDEITARILETTQNNYNRRLLQRLGVRVYLDPRHYDVYYRLPDRCLRFVPTWRQHVLEHFFGRVPVDDSGWQPCQGMLPSFEARFHPDEAGGALLLRRRSSSSTALPLLTATHGPYDPHTFEVVLYLLRRQKGEAALINLGFSGREPLSDQNLERLKRFGVPLNPSNIDVIYPYTDDRGHPYSYKLEENLRSYVDLLGIDPPDLLIDIHGCVGTHDDDRRLIVGLGGFPPWPIIGSLGTLEECDSVLCLQPAATLRRGLSLLRDLSGKIMVQLCTAPHQGFHFSVLGDLQMVGRELDPRRSVESLLPGEERTFLPQEGVRWLPGAGGNALQRIEARRIRRDMLCLHVEIPTRVRQKVALKVSEERIGASLDASSL